MGRVRLLGGPQDRRLLHSPAELQVAERTCERCRAKVRPADPEVAQALPPTWLLSGRLCALRPGSRRRSPSRPPRGRVLVTESASILLRAERLGGPEEARPLLAESGSGLLRQGFVCLKPGCRVAGSGEASAGPWVPLVTLSLFTFMHWRRKWQLLQCSCLENPRDGGVGSLVGCRLCGHTESDRTEAT